MPLSAIDPDARVPSAITTGLVVVSAIFPVLSAGAIYLRYLARRKARQSFYADDAWVLVAWIFTLVLSILVWVFTAKSGINYYNIDPLAGTSYSLEMIFLSACLIQFPLSTVKISILLFYKRIFNMRIFRVCAWIAIATVTIWGILFFFLVLTQVDPISQSWTGGRLRYDSVSLGLAQVGSSIALDFVVLCFPLPVISQLHMKSSRKLAISLIFWLGAFCGVAAIVRLVFLDQSVKAVVQSQNNVYGQSKQFIFLIIEPNCSIIAACLPCYGPLIAGGRAPESIVRSVRSVFSLRSNRSNQSPSSSVKNRSYPDTFVKGDSQIELPDRTYVGTSLRDVESDGGKASHERGPSNGSTNGINVTRGYTVFTK